MPGAKSRNEKGVDARTREKRLKASELRFRTLFEAAAEGILIADLETRRFVSANPAICRMLGYNAEELGAKAVEDIHPDESLGHVLACFQEQARGERLVAPALPCRRKDGSILYADVSSTTAVIDGHPCLVGFFTDVTERVRTEEALRASEERHRELFDHMSSCVAVYEARAAGEDFVFVDFNKAAERAEATRREDLIGKSVLAVFPGVKEFGLFEVFRRVWRTGTPEHHPMAEYRDKRIRGWRENYIYKLPSGEVVAVYDDITERKRADEELRASEERYRNLVERAEDGIIIIQDGVLRFVNPGIARIWGGTVAELLDTPFAEYIHPDALDQVVNRYERRMAGESVPSIYEAALRRKDGSKVYAELNAGIITHDGRPADFVIVRDITERKRAEDALRKAEERMSLAASAGNVGLWDWDLLTQQVHYSREWKRQIGYEEHEIADEFSEWQSRVHPDDLERSLKTVQSFIAHPWPDYRLEFRFRHKNGSYRNILTQASLLFDEHGTPIRMLGSHVDITERVRAERSLHESDENLRRAEQIAHVGYWSRDVASGEITWSDEAYRIFGLNPQEKKILVSSLPDYIHPEDCRSVSQGIEDALGGVRSYDLEYRAVRPDGTIRWVRSKGEVSRDGRGDPIRMFGVVLDITERKEAEERIRWLSSLPAENPNPVLRIASDGTLLYGNKASEPALRAWGCDVGRAVPPRFQDLARRSFREGPQTDEVQLDDRSLLVTFSPVAAEGYVNVYSADITQRKLIETALRHSEEKYRLVVERASEAIFIVQDRCIAFANPATARLVEHSAEEIVGQPFVKFLHPEDRATVAERHRRRLAGEVSDTNYLDRVVTGKGEVRWASINAVRVEWQGRPATLNLVSDVTEYRQAEAQRERLLARQLVLNRITLSLGALMDLPSILRTLHNEVRTLLDAPGFFVSRYHKETGLITALFVVDEGVERDVSTFPPIPLAAEGKGMQSQVLRTGQPLNIGNWIERERVMQTVYHIAPDGAFTAPPPEDEREGCTKSALLVPMMLQGEPVGVLQVQSNRVNAYSDEDVLLLAGVANVAAISIQDVLLAEEVRHGLEGTIEALARTTEMRDPYTAGHQRRVSQLSCAIAERMGLGTKAVEGLRVSGLLHDVGKVSVPAEILSKPCALTPLELGLVKIHSQTGFDVLKGIVFPWPVAEIVLQHHERMDGSGYPRGLKGKAILLESRILAVADVVEAMTSHRPYRSALGIDEALAELEAGAGVAYDPEVVKACLQLFSEGYTIPPPLPEANAV